MRIKRTLVASAAVVSLVGVGACGVNKDEDKPKDCPTSVAMSSIEMEPVGYTARNGGTTGGGSRPAPAPAKPAPAKPKPADPVKPAPAQPKKPKHKDSDWDDVIEEMPQEEAPQEEIPQEDNSGGTTGGVPTPTSTCEDDENY